MALRLNPWAPPNIRFWIWWNDGPVKITVKPGQIVPAYRWSWMYQADQHTARHAVWAQSDSSKGHGLWRQAPLQHCPKKLHLAGHRTGLLLIGTVPLALARIGML